MDRDGFWAIPGVTGFWAQEGNLRCKLKGGILRRRFGLWRRFKREWGVTNSRFGIYFCVTEPAQNRENLVDDVLHGILVFAHVDDFVMEVWSSASSGIPNVPDNIAAFYPVAFFDIERG